MKLKNMGNTRTTRRNKYQHHTKMTLMCRICLTKSNNFMFKLEQEFEHPEGEFVSYLKALEHVTTSKVVLNGDYPEYICPVCASVLKMSFKFIRQFNDSQMQLRKQFNYTNVQEPESENDNLSIKKEEVDNTPNVELIFQNNKFSINDLLVVEKQEIEDCDFKGFLENLGKEVTATFVEEFNPKKPQDFNKEDMISVSVIDKDRIIPVRQLQIDEDANLIEYVLDDIPINIVPSEEQSDEVCRLSEQSNNENDNESIGGKNMSDDGENENIEYIEIDVLDQDAIDSLIIDRTEFVNSLTESNSNNETPRPKKVFRVGKRRKKQTPEVEDEFQKEVKFPCEICRNIFATSNRLRAHKNRVHFRKEKTFACEICGYLCRTRSAFVHHKLTHEEKQFKCQLCDKAYHTKAVLKVHMGTHANKRQHLCSVCGKGFNYPIALTYHMRLHTGEKNYHCDFCDRSFRMPYSLTRHRRTHTGDRPFSCRFCNRSFCSKGELKCHEYIHTGYRPYHCKYCRKGFSKTHNLKLHLLSHKGSHQCEICDRSFIEPAILKMHYKVSHKDLSQNEDRESTDSQRGNSNVVIMDYVEYK